MKLFSLRKTGKGGGKSPPVRRRGLKLLLVLPLMLSGLVASRAEAWIETGGRSRMRMEEDVASRAEAWIETRMHCIARNSQQVASRAEAWIETDWNGNISIGYGSRLPCGGVD